MTWAPKSKGGEERKAESGAEESLGCLNSDTKGTQNAHHPALGFFQPSIRPTALLQPPCGITFRAALLYLPLHLCPPPKTSGPLPGQFPLLGIPYETGFF